MTHANSMSEITRRRFFRYGTRAALVALLGKGVYNTTSDMIEFAEPNITISRLHPSFRGFTIALLTDFHSSFIVSREQISTAARLVMSKKPDIVVLTGDFISGSVKFLSGSVGEFNEKYLEKLVNALSGVSAPMGVYGVLGNHDFWSGPEAVEAITTGLSKSIGVIWLRNENVTLKKGDGRLDLLGVDDYWENSYSLVNAYRGLDSTTAKILLSHNPDVNENIHSNMKIDLVLSGHTHGGQVVLPVIGMPFLPSPFGQKYREGLIKDGDRITYVSRGIGHLMAPVRLNCPAEATVITLA